MILEQFPRDSSCTSCDLHVNARTVCVPTVHHTDSLPDARHAFVFIAQNPGHEEDEQGIPLIGKSGQYVRRVLCAPSFGENTPPLNRIASVFFTNVARCTTPTDTPPRDKHYRECSKRFLWPDLDAIRDKHDRTVLMCLGRPASAFTWQYLTGKKGSSAVAAYTKKNGSSFPLNTFFVATYHPAAFLRERSYHESIVNHMKIALDALLDRRPQITEPDIVKPFRP